ncbi:MAG: hypothetical protein IT430_03565 [Phycisphaerales bacterium]|nr:hypothetical protein [Phycisphaerales bacterium]
MPRPRPTSAPGRFIKRVVICLLFSAILQFAVAVALCAFSRSWGRSRLGEEFHCGDEATYYLIVDTSKSFGRDILVGNLFSYSPFVAWGDGGWLDPESLKFERSEAPAGIPLWSRFRQITTGEAVDHYPSVSSYTLAVEIGSGWPARSASCFLTMSDERNPFAVHDGFALESPQFDSDRTPSVIPLKVHWNGALINTILYALIMLIPLALLPAARRHLRHRRGRCPACNYDLRATTTSVCPECGAAITPRAAT